MQFPVAMPLTPMLRKALLIAANSGCGRRACSLRLSQDGAVLASMAVSPDTVVNGVGMDTDSATEYELRDIHADRRSIRLEAAQRGEEWVVHVPEDHDVFAWRTGDAICQSRRWLLLQTQKQTQTQTQESPRQLRLLLPFAEAHRRRMLREERRHEDEGRKQWRQQWRDEGTHEEREATVVVERKKPKHGPGGSSGVVERKRKNSTRDERAVPNLGLTIVQMRNIILKTLHEDDRLKGGAPIDVRALSKRTGIGREKLERAMMGMSEHIVRDRDGKVSLAAA
jgi:hypothetical protein